MSKIFGDNKVTFSLKGGKNVPLESLDGYDLIFMYMFLEKTDKPTGLQKLYMEFKKNESEIKTVVLMVNAASLTASEYDKACENVPEDWIQVSSKTPLDDLKKKWNLETFKVGDTVVQRYRWNVLAFDPKRSTVMPIKKFDSPIQEEEEEEDEEDEEEEEEEEEEEKNFDFTKDFVKNVFTNCGIRDLLILGSSITDLNDKPIDDLNDCECIVITSPMVIGGRVARPWKHLHKSLLKTHKELNDSGKKFQVVHVLYDPAHKKDDKFVAAPWAYVPYNKMNIKRKISGIGFTIEQTQTPNGLFVDSNLITRHVTKHGAKAYPWTRESLEKFNGE